MAIDINIPSQVKNYANLAAFPATGTLKTIFIAEDTNKTYRWTGSAYVEISPAGASGITIGTTAITSGTVGRVLFQGSGNVVQQSSSLFWDSTNNRLGIGTSSPNSALEVVDTGGASFVAAARFLVPNNNVAGRVSQFYLGQAMTSLNSISWSFHYQGNGSTANYQSFGFNGIATPALTMFGTLNVGINTTTDAGYKLDVNGTARVTNLTVNNSILGQGSTQSLVFNNGTGITTLSDNIGIQLNLNNNTFFSFRSSSLGGTNRFLMIANAIGNLPAQPDSCAVLQLYSTNAGFLPPRMTTTQKNAIASPATGLMVYDTTLNKLCVRTASAWETITSL